MGISIALMAVSIGMSLMSVVAQNKALGDQNKAIAEQNALEQEELTRQQEEVNDQSQEKKSDMVRKADGQFASMIVAMADGGGAGGINQLRLGADIGGIEGMNLARIEGNRRRQVESIQASKATATVGTAARIRANRSQGKINTINFIGGAASTISGGLPSSSGLQVTGGSFNTGFAQSGPRKG